MKTIVVYRSKSGYTRRYAKWIAQAVGADLRDGRRVPIADLMRYDTIVFGAAMYAGGINGLSLIKRNLWRLKGKKIIIFTLGATPVREEIADDIKNDNFTQKEQRQIQFFMLRGGFNFSRLTLKDKILMRLLKARLKRIKTPTADQRGMLAAFDRPVDFTSREHIEPIIEAITE